MLKIRNFWRRENQIFLTCTWLFLEILQLIELLNEFISWNIFIPYDFKYTINPYAFYLFLQFFAVLVSILFPDEGFLIDFPHIYSATLLNFDILAFIEIWIDAGQFSGIQNCLAWSHIHYLINNIIILSNFKIDWTVLFCLYLYHSQNIINKLIFNPVIFIFIYSNLTLSTFNSLCTCQNLFEKGNSF